MERVPPKCSCTYLTVNPWAYSLDKRAARMTDRDCWIHGDGPIRWKRPTEHYVTSHCGTWWITPIYGGLTRPESFQLQTKTADGWKVVGSGSTQRECKQVAADLDAMASDQAAAAARPSRVDARSTNDRRQG
jgi:hypothetical protein